MEQPLDEACFGYSSGKSTWPSDISLPLLNTDDTTAVSSVGSNPTRGTRERSKVVLAGVSGGFSRGTHVFVPPTDWSVLYKMKLS